MRLPKAWQCSWRDYDNRLTRIGTGVSAISKLGCVGDSGVLHKGRRLLTPMPLLPKDPQPCFASRKAEQDFYDQILFSRIRALTCRA